MTETEPKDDARTDEARMFRTLCAEANAARRNTSRLRLGGATAEADRTPRRLLARS